ncbi:hypothetical protein [Aliikangiella sp. IMCC44632]
MLPIKEQQQGKLANRNTTTINAAAQNENDFHAGSSINTNPQRHINPKEAPDIEIDTLLLEVVAQSDKYKQIGMTQVSSWLE